MIAYFSRDTKLHDAKPNVSVLGARILHKIILDFSAGEHVHLFVKRLITPASVRDGLVSVLTQCEYSYIALIYGFR